MWHSDASEPNKKVEKQPTHCSSASIEAEKDEHNLGYAGQ
jgi:hypothetical protein